ncbi:hypothetical protein DRQ07_05645 [candidate division KSB1 bacterium]|nr:MAG: hypothetical protein DRQ07_05645 [candidate division KSB1 bacterium]
MNKSVHYISLSLLFHAVIICSVYLLFSDKPRYTQKNHHAISIEFEKQPNLSSLRIKSKAHQTPLKIKPDNESMLFRLKSIKDEEPVNFSKNDILKPFPEKQNNLLLKKSLLKKINPALNFPQIKDKKFVSPSDMFYREFQKRTGNENSSYLPVTGIISALAKKLKKTNTTPEFDFIPSKNQIIAIKVLNNMSSATQIDLYSQSGIQTTAEHFDKELSFLVKKGFLKRKKISPQLILNFFGVPVEMSKQNIRNPVYQYSSRVSSLQLITFLQRQLFLQHEKLLKNRADSIKTQKKIKEIKEKILLLVQ